MPVGACAATEGAHGQGARTRAPLMMAAVSHHVVVVGRIRACPSFGSRTGGAAWLQGGAYICFVVAKPSPLGSLPSTCKVLCLGLWRLRDLALHTYGGGFC
jgi:hypothetical protein